MLDGIRKARKEKGLSQQELSELVGVSRTIISGLECGRRCVTTTGTIKKLAHALDKNVEDIFFAQDV